jgi:hypothetical protein
VNVHKGDEWHAEHEHDEEDDREHSHGEMLARPTPVWLPGCEYTIKNRAYMRPCVHRAGAQRTSSAPSRSRPFFQRPQLAL